MKKVLFPILALVLALSLALPMATAVGAATINETYQSDTTDMWWSGAASSDIDGSGYIVPPSSGWSPAVLYSSGSFPGYWSTYLTPPASKTILFNSPAADWIWKAAEVTTGEAQTGDTVFFKKEIDIPANAVNIQADLYITTDNGYYFYVNNPSWSGTPDGQDGFGSGYGPTNYYYIATGSNISGGADSTAHETIGNVYPLEAGVITTASVWQGIEHYDVSGDFSAGTTNVLQIVAMNEHGAPSTPASNPASLIYKLTVTYDEVNPSIEVTKEADVDMVHHGDTITYTYEVENTGDVDLTLDKTTGVVDNDLSVTIVYDSGDGVVVDVLEVGETWVFTASYPVPAHTGGEADSIVDTATATAYLETTPITDDSDEVSVDILHPDIEVTKSGPTDGYFESVDAEYIYTVTNPGDCPLEVTLTDSMIAELDDPEGDTHNTGYLDTDETWTYTVTEELICECETITCFTNIATVVGVDEIGGPDGTVEDTACWTVLVFQWLPRTIGFWGNWDNHLTDQQMNNLLRRVNIQSDYFGWTGDDSPKEFGSIDDIHDFLLSKMKGKMEADKAETMLAKQLLAAWLSVKSYEGATDDNTATYGDLNWAMDPNATVYFDTGGSMTVEGLLHRIENAIGSMDVDGLLLAKDIVESLNTTVDDGYSMFIPPWFDADACPLILENKDSGDWSIIPDGTAGKLFHNESGDTFDFIFCAHGLDAGADYSLIYYADFEDRMNVWGGNNPGALIATMTTDGHGSVCIAGSIDLGMDLPHEDDANGYIINWDYSGDPDYYAHATGAKIWLVPSGDYNGTDTVTNWNPDDFLFETDLIWYNYTGD